jgi:hypothetical protein
MSIAAEPDPTDLALNYSWVRRLASVSLPDSPQTARHCWLFNLSASTVVLIVESQISPGTLLSVELCGAGREAPSLRLSARVNHCGAMPSGQWLAACDFTPLLAPGALESLR